MSEFASLNTNHLGQMIRNARESVKAVLRIIHANCFALRLIIFQCYILSKIAAFSLIKNC